VKLSVAAIPHGNLQGQEIGMNDGGHPKMREIKGNEFPKADVNHRSYD